MDIRIVNTCDSDCIYCLEQSLRKKQKFIQRDEIFKLLQNQRSCFPDDRILAFYGGNSLLHPELRNIITDAQELGFQNISVLTNTQGITKNFLESLIQSGLTGISFYFHSLDFLTHNMVVQEGISLEELYKNISVIQNSGLSYTCIIHVHQQNIGSLYKIVAELYVKYSVRNFEFIRVRLLGRAKKKFSGVLEIQSEKVERDINNLERILQKIKAQYKFVHFENK